MIPGPEYVECSCIQGGPGGPAPNFCDLHELTPWLLCSIHQMARLLSWRVFGEWTLPMHVELWVRS